MSTPESEREQVTEEVVAELRAQYPKYPVIDLVVDARLKLRAAEMALADIRARLKSAETIGWYDVELDAVISESKEMAEAALAEIRRSDGK